MTHLKLKLASVDDLDTLARVDRSAWLPKEHPFMEAMFQHEETPSGLQNKVNQWKAMHGQVRNERHFTVIDAGTNEMILSAKVLLPCSTEDLEELTQLPKLSGPFWDSENDREWAEHVLQRYTARRRDAFRKSNGRVFAITLMAVHSDHQKKGAGSLFMRYITDQADALGYECTVESALRAETFYTKHGFQRVERCAFPPPMEEERWKDKGTQEYLWMVRPPSRVT